MIGNDIVDLHFAKTESPWRRPGFLEKVFTQHERECIESSTDPNALVWRFWSMKESAYKAYQRTLQARFFNPRRLSCSLANEQEGMVRVGLKKYKTITTTTDKFVYTIALSEEIGSFDTNYFLLNDASYQTQHREIYRKVHQKMAELFGIPQAEIAIKKSNTGIPGLFVKNNPLESYLTITHHGHYAAYALSN